MDVFERPHKLRLLEEAYGTRMILASTALAAFLTGAAMLSARTWPLLVITDHRDIDVVWILVGLHIPAMLVSRWCLSPQRRRLFWWAFLAQGLLQGVWAQHLAWVSIPHFWAIAVMFLASLMFHDAWLCHSRVVPWLYALTFPTFDVYLLVLDELGRVGLRAAYAEKPGVVVGMLVTQMIVCFAMLAFIREVDRRSDASDRALAERERADFRAAVLRKEREVIRRSVGLLSSGISASQFSHDVATPVTALRINLAFLRDRLAGDADALAAIIDAETVARELHAMTEALSRSLRDSDEPAATPIDDVVRRAISYAQDLLRARGAIEVRLSVVDVDATRVWVVDGHVSALANLVVNAVVHSQQALVDVRGRVLDDEYYELSFRDFGVTGSARDSAMARVRRSMSLVEPQLERIGPLDERSTGPVVRREGYGVGLMISRLHCVRYGGEIDVEAAEAGPGIVFRVLLARATDGDRRWGNLQ